ncbi:MAG: zinc chelation protein SecC [Gammaproteobacteria bacterium]|nr:zinc chelation protein SecC [Gammaproteobacteria bacterium]
MAHRFGAKSLEQETFNPIEVNKNGDCCQDPSCCPPRSPYFRDVPKVGRNDPCPCGNGKKFKKCCGSSA